MQEALVQADRSKDKFLAFLGHELRNPLSAISYAVSLLEIGREGRRGPAIAGADPRPARTSRG